MISRWSVATGLAVFMAALLIVDAHASDERQNNEARYSPALAEMNASLAAAGANYRIETAEVLVESSGWTGAGQTLLAKNRTHRLEVQFVERDPRRGGFADISYLVDQSDGSALAFANPTGNTIVTLSNDVTEPILDSSMLRWQNEPGCPGPQVTKIGDDGSDPDIVDALLTGNPALFGTPRADITHAGWLPGGFFALIGNPASILGVTFTLVFVDDDGNTTDINNDGYIDVAFREIYYNRGFGWSEGPSRPRGIDIDSVATHEAGHAFGLGHFGMLFLDANGVLHFAPRAVMNAAYVSPFASLVGTDTASFCSIWANRR